jgi:hypothetical protein
MMPMTFESSKDQVAALVRQFGQNRAAYLAASYKEAHARQEFIDKLLLALAGVSEHDRAIDRLEYALCGLSEEELGVVEGQR